MNFEELLTKYGQKQFALTGFICFLVVLVFSTITLILSWDASYFSSKFSSISMLVFDVGLTIIFWNMYNGMRKVESLVSPTDTKEMDELAEEILNEGIKETR